MRPGVSRGVLEYPWVSWGVLGYPGVSWGNQTDPFLEVSGINRIYDGVEAETRKPQASFQII